MGKCACESVELDLTGNPYYTHGDCFCNDCNLRLRVCQERYCGPVGNSAINAFQPNGAFGMTGYSQADVKIVKGREHIGYFRGSRKADGSEWHTDPYPQN